LVQSFVDVNRELTAILYVCFTTNRIRQQGYQPMLQYVDYVRIDRQTIPLAPAHPVTTAEPNKTCNQQFPSHSSGYGT